MHTIKEWMQIKGLSKESIAAFCEVTTMTVSNWIKNPLRMSIGNALKLAQVFDVPVTDIDFFAKK